MMSGSNLYILLSAAQILDDLQESRNQLARGEELDMPDALDDIGKQHGFLGISSAELWSALTAQSDL